MGLGPIVDHVTVAPCVTAAPCITVERVTVGRVTEAPCVTDVEEAGPAKGASPRAQSQARAELALNTPGPVFSV